MKLAAVEVYIDEEGDIVISQDSEFIYMPKHQGGIFIEMLKKVLEEDDNGPKQ